MQTRSFKIYSTGHKGTESLGCGNTNESHCMNLIWPSRPINSQRLKRRLKPGPCNVRPLIEKETKEAALVILAESLDNNRLETKYAKRIELSINAIISPQALAPLKDVDFLKHKTMYQIRFANGQSCFASSEEEARLMTGNKTTLFSMTKKVEVVKENKEKSHNTEVRK